jgi:hypothetical protein
LGKADQTPEELEVLFRHQALSDSAFRVSDFNTRAVEPVLLGLKKLLLRIDAEITYIPNNPSVMNAISAQNFRRFLNLTPNVEHLRLNLNKYSDINNESLMKWLALPARASDASASDYLNPPPVDLAFLSVLDLGQFNIQSDHLLDILVKYAPTLKGLNFWKMSMRQQLPGSTDKPNLWSIFFRKMARIPQLQLNQLKVGMLSQEHTYVQFKSPDRNNAPLHKVKEYSGTKMGAFLKELEEEVTVMWPLFRAPVNEDSDQDEEMADNDEDESATDTDTVEDDDEE